MAESLLLAVSRVTTNDEEGNPLTNATGFFYSNAGDLFLVTNRHVVFDEATNHRPDSLSIEMHVDQANIAATESLAIPLYENGASTWTECVDSGGIVDVVAIRLNRAELPESAIFEAFTADHLVLPSRRIELGMSVTIVGFPLGFYDTLHHLPVARQASVASEFGLRFQGNGYFLTDARLHRGTSGAPVVAVAPTNVHNVDRLPWLLLGVHATRVDAADTDLSQDDRLGLNCAWYVDVLEPLTQPQSGVIQSPLTVSA